MAAESRRSALPEIEYRRALITDDSERMFEFSRQSQTRLRIGAEEPRVLLASSATYSATKDPSLEVAPCRKSSRSSVVADF